MKLIYVLLLYVYDNCFCREKVKNKTIAGRNGSCDVRCQIRSRTIMGLKSFCNHFIIYFHIFPLLEFINNFDTTVFFSWAGLYITWPVIIRVQSLVENLFKKNSFTRFAFQCKCCNFNQWERIEFITDHMT